MGLEVSEQCVCNVPNHSCLFLYIYAHCAAFFVNHCFLSSPDCHLDLFAAEGHAVFINRPDPGGRQLGLVFLVVDLPQGRLGQLFQLFVAAIFLRFQLDQDARKLLLRGKKYYGSS